MTPLPQRLLFVADGRSPISLNWIRYFIESGNEVHLVSTYPCRPELDLASLHIIPVAFAGAAGPPASTGTAGKSLRTKTSFRHVIRRVFPAAARNRMRHWLGPGTLPASASRLKKVIRQLQPHLVHAMRIPYEGMLAALADPSAPLLVSIWGNDFTLHASSSPWMSFYTRRTMKQADALHTDCYRDLHLARQWGFDTNRPAVVLPGAGGVQLDIFYPPPSQVADGPPVVINPRGIRAYVRSDTFFKAVPLVLKKMPGATFLCPAMEAEPEAQRWVSQLGIGGSVKLLPRLSLPAMADLYRQAQIAVSPSTHDGTPNTLLEAMASGCFPIAGDIESIREWIEPGQNGLLVDPTDPHALAGAILQAFDQPSMRVRAAQQNLDLIKERAEYAQVMEKAGSFYQMLASH